jgi:Acetyltransferases
MKIEKLENERISDFTAYCTRHRSEVDDSYLYGEDLGEFKPDEANPTYILTDDQGKIRGAASLVMDNYHRAGRRIRFRIFHTETNDIADYRNLLLAASTQARGMDELFVFVQLKNKDMLRIMKALNLKIWHYSFLLVKENISKYPLNLLEGYVIRPMIPGKDEAIWCSVRNEAFASLAGNETPMTEDIIHERTQAADYLENGAMILFHGDRPVGVVQGLDDEYDGAPIMCIGPLAIIPDYQGRGLGRLMLRTSMNFAGQHGYTRAVLCVNGENDRAKILYKHEGFHEIEEVVAYTYKLDQ